MKAAAQAVVIAPGPDNVARPAAAPRAIPAVTPP